MEGEKEALFPGTPPRPTETRVVCPASCTKATTAPSPERAGRNEPPLPGLPEESTETRVVCPVCWSCRKTSHVLLVSLLTRFVAAERKATKRPSFERALRSYDLSLPSVPSDATETRVMGCPSPSAARNSKLSISVGVSLPSWL